MAMRARRVGPALLALAGGYLAVLAVTRRQQHWGATDQEVTQPLPGDDLLPAAKLASTHAITIAAPAERIWPWLAQMGYQGRAGMYSYDVFERRFGPRNSDRLNPNLPPLFTGDCMPFAPGRGPEAAPPLVLLHATGTSSTGWLLNIGPLSQRYRVYAVDIVGEPGKTRQSRLLTDRADAPAGWRRSWTAWAWTGCGWPAGRLVAG